MAKSAPLFMSPRELDHAEVRARYIRNRSCYMPHQGKREVLRRRIGGFAGVASHSRSRDHDAAVAFIMQHHLT